MGSLQDFISTNVVVVSTPLTRDEALAFGKKTYDPDPKPAPKPKKGKRK